MSIGKPEDPLRCFSCNENGSNPYEISSCNKIFGNSFPKSVNRRYIKTCPMESAGCFILKTSDKENPSELLLPSLNHDNEKIQCYFLSVLLSMGCAPPDLNVRAYECQKTMYNFNGHNVCKKNIFPCKYVFTQTNISLSRTQLMRRCAPVIIR